MTHPSPPDIARVLQTAFQHHQQGEFAAAEQGYRAVLATQPEQPDANHLMGVLLDQTGHGEAGAALIRRAIQAAPGNADAHCNLGRVLEGLGRVEEALDSYRAALARRPDFGQARFNLAAALRKLGRLEEAIDAYRLLVDQAPGNAQALFNLGNALKAARRFPEAIASYRSAVAADPGLTSARVNLGNALWDSGDLSAAAEALLDAVGQEPDNAEACMSLALLLRGRILEAAGDAGPARAALLACLRRDDLEHQDLVTAATSVLLATAPPAVMAGQKDRDLGESPPDVDEPSVARFLADPLLRVLLSRALLMEPSLERFLTGQRAALLAGLAAPDARPKTGGTALVAALDWLVPLALQCFRNEYVYVETPAETAAVEALEAQLRSDIDAGAGIDPRLALYSCYRPLHGLPGAAALALREGPPWWTELARAQISEPLEERVLAMDMPRLAGASRPVSEAVRRQYEENPYPRWTGLYRGRPTPFAECLARDVDPARLEGARPITAPRVLIAGCGTGLHAISCALQYADCQVLAIDLSAASLAYASRRAADLGVTNVEFLQADLLDLESLDQRFDVIESVGVLHHLADPVAGWRVLRRLLEPGGYMKVGLYSELARPHVVAARNFVAQRRDPTTPAGIRAARAALLALPDNDPASGVVASGDFYSASGFRDLLLHVQEHRFTLPEIAGVAEELALEPLGFVLDEAVRADYRNATADDPHATSLSGWARYEAEHPATFGEMYQLWLRAID